MLEATSPEAVTAVASTWMGVRLVLPWLRSLPRGASVFTGQRTWVLVFASAAGVATLETLATGGFIGIASLLRDATAISVAAIGIDQVVQGSGDSD